MKFFRDITTFNKPRLVRKVSFRENNTLLIVIFFFFLQVSYYGILSLEFHVTQELHSLWKKKSNTRTPSVQKKEKSFHDIFLLKKSVRVGEITTLNLNQFKILAQEVQHFCAYMVDTFT